ncbi:MAG: hypothetical protein Q9170_004689 [Blastenia crenularia]
MAQEMKALLVEHDHRGDSSKINAKKVPKPEQPQGFDILVEIKAASVNPIDIKVRAGVYDDYPDYFDRCPRPYQIMGFDGAGVITAIGPSVKRFQPGDAVYFANSPVRHGSNAEYQLVDSRSIALKPPSLSFVQAASMPLTYITAYEALIERLEIQKGEQAALLIINGAGGVGSFASQIARKMLGLPVVVTTASRQETQEFSKEMGATHVVNHREDLVKQIADLNLDVPLKYIFITYNTDMYLTTCARICAPFGKVCSIVQGQVKMYGTEFMAKSLSFVWALLGTKPYYGLMLDSHGQILKELTEKVEKGEIKCTLKQTFPLTLEGLRKAHEIVESGGSIGKNALEMPEEDKAFV